jgi:hypothetical protein
MVFFAAWIPILLVTRTEATVDHEFSRIGTVESIVERGNYWLEQSQFHYSTDRIEYRGHFYSHQPPLLSTLEAPVFWLLSSAGLRFASGVPFDLTYFLFTACTSGAALSGIVVILYAILRMLRVKAGLSFMAALVLTFGTWLLPYGLVVNNHIISGFLLAGLAWLLLEIEFGRSTTGKCFLVGLGLGLLTTIEVLPAISFVPLTVLFMLAKARRSAVTLSASGVGLVIPLLLHAVLNIGQTGDLLPGGFHSELFVYEGSKFDSSTLTGNMNHRSVAEFFDYAWKALFVEKGYFAFAPVLLAGLFAGVFGWRLWSHARPVYLVMFGGTLLSLFASLMMTNNFGGFASGFRHATYLAPAFLLMLAPIFAAKGALARATSWMLLVMSAASIVMLVLVTVPRPWWPYKFPPHKTVIEQWYEYVPVVAQIGWRIGGVKDEFGRPRSP